MLAPLTIRPTPAPPPAPKPADMERPAGGGDWKVKWPEPARASWFRTGDQVGEAMHRLADEHPDLAHVEQVGSSVEGRPIWMLRLTAPRTPASTAPAPSAPGPAPASRPKVLHVGGVHAREIANPELVMRHLDELVRGYGIDAEATHILDTTEVLAIPMLNVDGHAIVERGFDGIDARDAEETKQVWQRRNAGGVDLNRNFPEAWDAVPKTADPTSQNYRGLSPASEPEVRALIDVVERERPDMYLDWHSQGETNLIPYGHTKQPSPHDDGLRAIAGQFALRNGYLVQPSSQFTTDSGTSKDWVHATFDIPAFTIETGTVYHQTDADFANSWSRNADVFRYAEHVAADPWRLGMGPTVDGVNLLDGRVSALARTAAGRDAAVGAELVRDPLAPAGTGASLAVAADGRIDAPLPDLTARGTAPPATPAPSSSRAPARELAYVRARDAAGHWGPLTPAWLS